MHETEGVLLTYTLVSLPTLIDPPLCLGNGVQRMANKRHKPEEIVQKLRQVDVLVGQG